MSAVRPGNIRALAVVVPARNESELVARCLRSLIAAREFAVSRLTDPPTISITVVADACTDETAAIARAFDCRVLEIDVGSVGVARAAGVRFALAQPGFASTDTLPDDTAPDETAPQETAPRGTAPHGTVWIANTDADSVVPQNWILEQLALADSGIDVIIGTVRPDFADLSAAHIRAWHATRHPGRANGHVHGANLGIRASRYLAAGGFTTIPEHEDVDLIERCAALGDTTFATDSCEVMTSGRHHGRTPGGYARYLRVDLLARAASTSLR